MTSTMLKWLKRILKVLLFPLWLIWRAIELSHQLEDYREKMFNLVVMNRCRSCGYVDYRRARSYVGYVPLVGERIRDVACPKCKGDLFLDDGELVEL